MRRDVSGLRTVASDDEIARRLASGEWTGRTIVDLSRALVATCPDRVLVIEGETRLTVRTIWDRASALAASLHALGLRPGDVVAMQLPNWAETTIIYLAASRAGLILNPILPILRDSEVGFMLRDSRSRLIFVPREHRGVDHLAMIERLRPDLPDLDTAVVLRGDAGAHRAFDELIGPDVAPVDLPDPDPRAVKIVMYTSGTTGRPKGVLHTHDTLQAEILSYIGYWGLNERDVLFMASPVSHITGCLMAFELPWAIAAPVVLQVQWHAAGAVELFLEHGVTYTSSSTPFLRELLAAARDRATHLPRFTRFVCGGMTIPPDLIREAHDWFGDAVIGRCFGMSEVPSITLAIRDRGQIDKGADTDGVIAPGVEVRIANPDDGSPIAIGAEGEILVKAPERFVGYHRPEDNDDAFDDDGFFRTGDIGMLVDGDCLLITGRKKDLIIRGGENLSAREIEQALLRHPAVADVAVVAMPHPRLGEGVACFIVAKEGRTIDQPAVSAFLIDAALARQKIPERVELIDALPRNFQGKVLKNELRERMRLLCKR